MSRVDEEKRVRTSSLDISREDLAELSSAATDLVREYFDSISDRDVFPENHAGKATQLLNTNLPVEGASLREVIEECRKVIDLNRHNGHPRFFGYVASGSTPIGAYSDLIASALNVNVTCWRSGPAATEVERMVIRWLGQLIGYDTDGKGLLTSGGSMANLIALLIASRRKTGANTARAGLWNSGAPLCVYASTEVHMSIPKAADILGFGRDYVRLVPCDHKLRMDVSQLRERIKSDVAQGLRPFCVVASAGTVGSGTVDLLLDIAAVAKEFDLWFHVDGAYGALAMLDPESMALFDGLELADSVSLDPHKWLYIPIDVGSLLFRDESAARQTFSVTDADYIKTHGLSDDAAFAFWDYGIELSRRFRALKVWLTLRYYGKRRLADAIADDIALAKYLAELVSEADDFELLAPVELSICCFRYLPESVKDRLRTDGQVEAELNELNEKIMSRVQRSGRAYISNATINGKFALRVCITNFRTTERDLEETLNVIREAAKNFR
jgi:glutamate/tyrosine decarboxylase-like PLP-dependent enzyme